MSVCVDHSDKERQGQVVNNKPSGFFNNTNDNISIQHQRLQKKH